MKKHLKPRVKILLILLLLLLTFLLITKLLAKQSEGEELPEVIPPLVEVPEEKPDEEVEVPEEPVVETPPVQEKPVEKPPVEKPPVVTPPVEKPPVNEGSLPDAANYSSITALINKKQGLPRSYKPSLKEFPSGYAVSMDYWARPETVNAYLDMVNAMKNETGLWMYVTSAYRGYDSQERLFNNYVAQHGKEEALRFVAYPGTSEHQTGLVVDLVTPGGDMFAFGKTEQSQWVNQNAHRFGFVVRYEAEFESITGYMAEAWHLRYLGQDIATAVYNSGRPFDEYYNANIR